MLSQAPVDISFDTPDDDWVADPPKHRLYRAASVGNSWGVTSIGRGFDWEKGSDDTESSPSEYHGSFLDPLPTRHERSKSDYDAARRRNLVAQQNAHKLSRPHLSPPQSSPQFPSLPNPIHALRNILTENLSVEPSSMTPDHSRPGSPRVAGAMTPGGTFRQMSGTTSPSRPRSSRRSSQARVSLVAGRVLVAPIDAPSPIELQLQPGTATNGPIKAPPLTHSKSFLGERKISEFSIEKEIGRGAYGLVKRAREIQADGSLGPPLVIKQVIKSRILADCWKRHPVHGTIPIEIHVMSAISATDYILPPRRPWDPARLLKSPQDDPKAWVEGKVIKGHPNICPLIDFFEDDHYYYLVLPSTTPEQELNKPAPPSDLFDLVENFPHGLDASAIRSYLGQLADALCFLHAMDIVHRDIKDENVVLGTAGRCVLIDFGSSGLVRGKGWDTFSGTLDYAGPEILRGERYFGKEQDVWAFGVVAYVLIVGECPFTTSDDAQMGLSSPFASARIALDERCGDDRDRDGEEADGGGALGDAAALVRQCLQVEPSARPTFEKILKSRFLCGRAGWA